LYSDAKKDLYSYILVCHKSYYEKFADGTVKCIDEEIPFEIPESWEWCRLGSITKTILYGISESAQPEGNYKLLRITDIQNNTVDWENVPFTTLPEDKAMEYLLRKNDILFARTGATVGKSYLVKETNNNTIYASYLIRVRLFESFESKYIKFYFESGFYWDQITEKSVGVGQPNVNGASLKSLLLPVPPHEEQVQIGEQALMLTNIIDNIDNNKNLLSDSIKNAKSKILDLAMQGKLVPQDPNDEPASVLLERIKSERPESKKKVSKTSDNSHYTFNLPESWAWTTIGEISQHNTGKTLDRGRNSGTLHKYITTSNLYWDSFVLDNLKEMPFEENELYKYSAIKGDLLICEGGDGGRSAIWDKEYPICFQNHVHRVRPFSGIRSKYIYFFMLHSSSNGYINYYKKGIGIQSLSGNSLSSIRLPLPPLSEQKRIVKKIEEIFTSLDEIENSIKA